MPQLIFERLSAPDITLNEKFEPGLHVLWGRPQDGVGEVLQLAAGQRPPGLGQVLLDGAQPHKDPKLRARIGTLFETEEFSSLLAPGDTVNNWLNQCYQLRGQTRDFNAAMVDKLAIRPLLNRRISSLSAKEQRDVALLVALTVERPLVLALWSPFECNVPPAALRAALLAAAKNAVVLLAGPDLPPLNLRQCSRWLFKNKHLLAGRSPGQAGAPGNPTRFHVTVTDASPFLAELVRSENIIEARETQSGQGNTCAVSGQDAAATARAILSASNRSEVPIIALIAEPRDLKTAQIIGRKTSRAPKDHPIAITSADGAKLATSITSGPSDA